MRGAALVAALAFALGGCGDDEEEPVATATSTATATATATAAPTTVVDRRQPVLWPGDRGAPDPESAARSFAVDFIGIDKPALSGFKEGEPGVGEVDLLRLGEDGSALDTVLSTLSLREIGEGKWFVTSAQSPDIEIDTPEPLAEVPSPVEISGRGRGFEGNIVLALHVEYATDATVTEPVIAGSMGDLESFTASLTFSADPRAHLALVATAPGGTETPLGVTAIPLRTR